MSGTCGRRSLAAILLEPDSPITLRWPWLLGITLSETCPVASCASSKLPALDAIGSRIFRRNK